MNEWLVKPGDTQVIELETLRSLKVSLIGGQVDVIGHDEPTARLEVHGVTGKELKIVNSGDHLEIDHPQLRWDNFLDVFRSWHGSAGADVSLLVPRDVALKFGVVSAAALVSGLTRSARLSTVSGDLVVDGTVGDLDLNGVSAEISVRGHTGRVTAHTVSGDVTLHGTLSRVSSDSVSGNVFVDAEGATDEIRTNSVSGNLTVRLRGQHGCRYTLNTVSGHLQLDDRTFTDLRGRGCSGTVGSLDGHWSDLRANTVSGNVSVLLATGTADERQEASV